MKRFLIVLASLAICYGRTAAQDLPPEILADQYLLEAASALENEEWEKAIQALRKIEALDVDPPVEFYFTYGKVLVERGTKYDELRRGESLLKQYVLKITRGSEDYTPALKLLSSAASKIKAYGYAPLHDAAIMGEPETVETLIAAGADVHAKAENGGTPLHFARSGDVVNALIAAGADVHARGKNGATPLHLARSSDVVNALIAAGADVHAKRDYENTPLHDARSGDAVEALIAAGADVHAKAENGGTPLHFARSGDVVEALIAAGADVHAKAENGGTPLHFARSGDVVNALIAAGADVHAKRDYENTPLHDARSGDVVEALIAAGADLEAKDNFGSLHKAAGMNRTDVVEALIAAGADVHATDDIGRTALFWTESGDVVKTLIAAGADVHARNNWGRTRLFTAAIYGEVDVVKALIAAGVDVSKGQAGRGRIAEITPLHAAAGWEFWRANNDDKFVRKKIEIIRALIAAGADINSQDYSGFTPLSKALKDAPPEIIEVLRALGAHDE